MEEAESACTRREVLHFAAGTAAALMTQPARGAATQGRVAGQAEAAKAGDEVLRTGGNAVDAIVSAALVAAVVAIHNCGIGGYGGHAIVGLPDGKVTAVDFDSAAPIAALPTMFTLDGERQLADGANSHGWLAVGVPGTLAGLQLLIDHWGTRSFAELVQRAIAFAETGFALPAALAGVLGRARQNLMKDPATARLLLVNGEAPKEGAVHRNPELGSMLRVLADRGRVDTFYSGDIGRTIGAESLRQGGLLSPADMGAYRARTAQPLRLDWNGYSIRTAPLPAGGLTVLQALRVLKELQWEKLPVAGPKTAHALLDALRLCWHDRVTLIGHQEHVPVPVERLLSPGYARKLAGRVDAALLAGRPVNTSADDRSQGGTTHLSATDRNGMMAALTLTHGEAFGAQVTVPGLGLLLGHGMSRFDSRPGHPNAPGPGKRPLTNMCPTLVLRDGQPALAIGGAGGRKIVTSMVQVLARFVGRRESLETALGAPRLHTEGGVDVALDALTPPAVEEHLRAIGYAVRRAPAGGNITAVLATPV